MKKDRSLPRRGYETQYQFLYLVASRQQDISCMGGFHFHQCGRRLRSERGYLLGLSLRRS